MKTYLGNFFDKADAGSIIHLAAIIVVPTMVIVGTIGMVYLASRVYRAVKRRKSEICFTTKGHLPRTSSIF